MGVFPEDHVIRVSELIKLWVAGGFLKPVRGKSLEKVAKEYFNDLIDRNLILVHKLASTGSIKECKIHDLLRDLCLREAHNDRFYHVIGQPIPINPEEIYTQRHIIIPESIHNEDVRGALRTGPLVRSVICDRRVPFLNFPLLRIFSACGEDVGKLFFLGNASQLVKLRCIAVKGHLSDKSLSSLYLLWNLQTIVVSSRGRTLAPADVVWNIWKMPQLRHVEFRGGLYLPDPPSQNIEERAVVSSNLQTLMTINNFNCSKEVAKRIPNIKKLVTQYSASLPLPPCFNSFDRLQKLESLCCVSHVREPDFFHQNLNFPRSLKKLCLTGNDYMDKIGSLPLLEKVIFKYGSFKRPVWETDEGHFCSLKFLKILGCYGLENWKTEYTHFPRLEHLVLEGLLQLEELPSYIGEIPTLQSIIVHNCRESAVISAKRILEEHGEIILQIRVGLGRKNESLERLASPNFYIHYGPNG